MNKSLLFLVLLLPLSVLAEDIIVNAPCWEDFAPAAFVDVQEPRGLGKMNVSAKYWYERRVDFEKGLEACEELSTSDEKFVCYEELKVKQYKENTDYNARIEARQNNQSVMPEMRDRTDMMLPINSYVDTFRRMQPTEF